MTFEFEIALRGEGTTSEEAWIDALSAVVGSKFPTPEQIISIVNKQCDYCGNTGHDDYCVMSEGELDEVVHDMKGFEAAAINNGGKEEQLRFLRGEE